MNREIEAYFKDAEKWRDELKKLRKIILDCLLTEEFKWGKPCYTFRQNNLVILLPLKEHCALLFCKGALLKDVHGLLIKPGEETQAARQMRFKGLHEIVEKEAIVKTYIHEAIGAEKAGLEITYKKITERAIPAELESRFDKSPALKKAFRALTPGRQRAYLMFFSAPKQSKTREARVEKCTRQILAGEGLND